MSFRRFKLVCIVLLFPSLLSAACTLTTEDSVMVEQGSYEIETVYEFEKNSHNAESHALAMSIKHGITGSMHICINIPYDISPDPGAGNSELGMKLRLLDSEVSEVCLGFSIQPGQQGYSVIGISSLDTGLASTYMNLGYVLPDTGNDDGLVVYGLSFEYPAGGNMLLGAEIYGEKPVSGDEGRIQALLGISKGFSDSLTLDLGLGSGLNESGPKVMVISGVVLSF